MASQRFDPETYWIYPCTKTVRCQGCNARVHTTKNFGLLKSEYSQHSAKKLMQNMASYWKSAPEFCRECRSMEVM